MTVPGVRTETLTRLRSPKVGRAQIVDAARRREGDPRAGPRRRLGNGARDRTRRIRERRDGGPSRGRQVVAGSGDLPIERARVQACQERMGARVWRQGDAVGREAAQRLPAQDERAVADRHPGRPPPDPPSPASPRGGAASAGRAGFGRRGSAPRSCQGVACRPVPRRSPGWCPSRLGTAGPTRRNARGHRGRRSGRRAPPAGHVRATAARRGRRSRHRHRRP